MANITNNYAPGSCTFEAGSSQNGDITITGPVYQGVAPGDVEAGQAAGEGCASPVHLSKKKGNRINLIRIVNAIYETGMVEDARGGKLTKLECMVAVGRAFNVDLRDYDKDLSQSMSAGGYESQTRIFDEMKRKTQETYNGK